MKIEFSGNTLNDVLVQLDEFLRWSNAIVKTEDAREAFQPISPLPPTPLEQAIAKMDGAEIIVHPTAPAPEPKKGGKKAKREKMIGGASGVEIEIKDADTDFPIIEATKPAAEEAKALTLADVRAAAKVIVEKEDGTNKTIAILKQFDGADRVTALKEEHYAAFVKACSEAVA